MKLFESDLVLICRKAIASLIVDPAVEIGNISVLRLDAPRFQSWSEITTFVVTVSTNDSSALRGDCNRYKGSYKERIEGALDYYAKTTYGECDVHLEIIGPAARSVERLILAETMVSSGKLHADSPIIQTARRFSIPDILVRGRHLIAPSPALATYLERIMGQTKIYTALDLFGGTGLTASVLCCGTDLNRITVVENVEKHYLRMGEHLTDPRVNLVHGDAFKYLVSKYDLIVADPYYEDAIEFLHNRLNAIMDATRIFLFVPGKIEDIQWNEEVYEILARTGCAVLKTALFGQVIFDVRTSHTEQQGT